MRTVPVGVERVEAETGLALLLVIDGEELWVPKSVIEDPDAIEIGDEEIEVEIAAWFAEKEGLV